MKMRYVTAAGAFAAALAVAGCGTDEGIDAEDTYTYSDEQEITEPAEPMTGEGEDADYEYDQPEDFAGAETGEGGDQMAGETTAGEAMGGEDVQMTEFAALDTNADGEIGEQEWQSDAVGGTEFDEADIDGDGIIDPEEFRQAAGSGASVPQSPQQQ